MKPITLMFAGLIAGASLAFNAAPAAAQGAAAASARPLRIAVANPARIFNEMAETKALQGRMMEEQKKFVGLEKEKRATIEQLRAQRDQLKADHPQFQEINGQLLTASLDYKLWGESQKALAEQRQKHQMRQLFDKVQSAVAEVAKNENIDMVMAEQRDPLPDDLDSISIQQLKAAILSKDVLYASKDSDISDRVLALLDARFKAAGTGPAPAPAGGAPPVNPVTPPRR